MTSDDDDEGGVGAASVPVNGRGGAPDPQRGIEHHLPSAILATVLSKLDPRSLCSAAATCRSLRSCGSHALSFTPSFHLIEVALPMDLLDPLLPPNPQLQSLWLDCRRLNDGSIGRLLKPSLHELCLHNCENLSGSLLRDVGETCRDLRSLSLSYLAERRGLSVCFSDLEALLFCCSHLESLNLAFDFSGFYNPKFAEVWETASKKLASLEIGYIPGTMLSELLQSTVDSRHHMNPPMFPTLQKLYLAVDVITDYMVGSISTGLPSLTHLDLQDAPFIEPISSSDLTNSGLQQINSNGRLKHISLIRSHEFSFTYFRRVNDLGLLLMSDTCVNLESICLGGFCRVTDSGFRSIIHSCSNLRKLRVSHGSQMTDLVFHDISATTLSLTHVSLRWCNLITNVGIARLSVNAELTVLDLRDCRNLGDEAVRALGCLRKLEVLLLDGIEITDLGLGYLGRGECTLKSLSLRGCRRLTDDCIPLLFARSRALRILDLSRLPGISDHAIDLLARSRAPIAELRLRECPRIGDRSVMVLASMQVEGGSHGSSLCLLDIFECGGITPLAIRWFKKPYFPRLRWLGVTGSLNRDMVDALVRSRLFLHVACRGEELGAGYWAPSRELYREDEDELDELERWIMEGEDGSDDDAME